VKDEKIFGGVLAIFAIVLIAFAVIVPMQKLKKETLDSQTAMALNMVSAAVETYVSKNDDIPKSVNDLTFESGAKPAKGVLARISIQENSDYGYKLCANFYTDTKIDLLTNVDSPLDITSLTKDFSSSSYYNYGNYSLHDAGIYCFPSISSYYDDTNYYDDYYDDSYYDDSSTQYSCLTSDQITIKACDTKRQTDIKALHSQLEAYFAQNGMGYPVLADLNSTLWRSDNMYGLDDAALCDPSNTVESGCAIANKPVAGAYAYQTWQDDGVTPCTGLADNGDTCAKYTLTATLQGTVNGSGLYIKNSLN
jgi:hypothetical protein